MKGQGKNMGRAYLLPPFPFPFFLSPSLYNFAYVI